MASGVLGLGITLDRRKAADKKYANEGSGNRGSESHGLLLARRLSLDQLEFCGEGLNACK